VHICIIGETATAKTTLLRWAANFLPRGVYASGTSASGAGLTAAVVVDSDSGEKVVRPGALIQAATGICCIDDFHRLSEGDQASVREALDQQTVTLSKAGIHARLDASASVVVACSPSTGCYDAVQTLQENAGMSPQLLSCFDLVQVARSCHKSSDDEAVACHILALACGERRTPPPSAICLADLRRYVQFARTICPEMTAAASMRVANCYAELRRRGRGSAWVTPRSLDSLVRLSEAVARGRLDEWVHAEHVDEAFELVKASCCFDLDPVVQKDVRPASKRRRLLRA